MPSATSHFEESEAYAHIRSANVPYGDIDKGNVDQMVSADGIGFVEINLL